MIIYKGKKKEQRNTHLIHKWNENKKKNGKPWGVFQGRNELPFLFRWRES